MAYIEQDMRAEDGVHCRVCNEPMPPYTRLCPDCIVARNPLDILEDMRSMVAMSAETAAKMSRREFEEWRATFWTLHGAAATSFAREQMVVESIDILEKMLYDIVDERESVLRHQREKRKERLLKISAAVVLSISIVAATIWLLL